MNDLLTGFQLILTRKDSRFVIIVSTVCCILFLFIVQNGKEALSVFQFHILSVWAQYKLAFSTLFDISNTFSVSTGILALLGSFIGGFNLSLAYTYIRLRGELILQSGLYSGIGLLLAFLGIGCAACGTAFLSVILGFFGFSAMLNMLPYQGLEIGYIGLIILCIATYVLAQKVNRVNVC